MDLRELYERQICFEVEKVDDKWIYTSWAADNPVMPINTIKQANFMFVAFVICVQLKYKVGSDVNKFGTPFI